MQMNEELKNISLIGEPTTYYCLFDNVCGL